MSRYDDGFRRSHLLFSSYLAWPWKVPWTEGSAVQRGVSDAHDADHVCVVAVVALWCLHVVECWDYDQARFEEDVPSLSVPSVTAVCRRARRGAGAMFPHKGIALLRR